MLEEPKTKPLTAAQLKRRAEYAKLKASCNTLPNTSIASAQAVKQKPLTGIFGSI